MPTYIERAHSEQRVEYTREFRNAQSWGGFSFDCDSLGNVWVKQLRPDALKNYEGCIDGSIDVVDEGVSKREWTHRHRAIIQCDCKANVRLGHSTNTCHECGADYNMSGQRLAPRSQWGEETGETWEECY